MNVIRSLRLASIASLLVLLFTTVAQAQTVTVTGTVKDTTGEPVIGASVAVVGVPGKGATADLDGNFTITAVPSDATLRISFVGMKTQEIALQGRTHIDVVLHEDSELLDEVSSSSATVRRRKPTSPVPSPQWMAKRWRQSRSLILVKAYRVWSLIYR